MPETAADILVDARRRLREREQHLQRFVAEHDRTLAAVAAIDAALKAAGGGKAETAPAGASPAQIGTRTPAAAPAAKRKKLGMPSRQARLVEDALASSLEPLDYEALQEKTGLAKSQLYPATQYLLREGRIRREGRGVFGTAPAHNVEQARAREAAAHA